MKLSRSTYTAAEHYSSCAQLSTLATTAVIAEAKLWSTLKTKHIQLLGIELTVRDGANSRVLPGPLAQLPAHIQVTCTHSLALQE